MALLHLVLRLDYLRHAVGAAAHIQDEAEARRCLIAPLLLYDSVGVDRGVWLARVGNAFEALEDAPPFSATRRRVGVERGAAVVRD
jgi:hypothetical protein